MAGCLYGRGVRIVDRRFPWRGQGLSSFLAWSSRGENRWKELQQVLACDEKLAVLADAEFLGSAP